MSVTAKLKYLRIAPRKVRLVTDLIRGKSVEEAQNILNFLNKKSAGTLLKLIRQAVDSAQKNFQLNENNLYILKITVDEGPKYKRWRARSRGRADMIKKRTSNITLVLDETTKGKGKTKRAKKVTEPEITEKTTKMEKPQKEKKLPKRQIKFKPEKEIEKPRVEKGIKRIFRRKAFG
jgi:large subunit ribosomal protein L22